MKTPIRKTAIHIPDELRENSIDVLNMLLAEFLGAALVTKQAHWNLSGPKFISIHEKLDVYNTEFLDFADQVAERAVQLGGVPNGIPSAVAVAKSGAGYPLDIHSIKDHLNELLDRFAGVANTMRELVQRDDLENITTKIIEDALQIIDTNIWFIESELA